MNYFELNIELLEKNHGFLYKGLQENTVNKCDKIEAVYSVETKNREQSLFVKYRSKEIRLNSIYNPSFEASRWVKQFNFKNLNKIIIMFGMGNGVFAKAILNEMKQDDYLFICEPSYEIFDFVLKHYDLTDILNNKQVSLGVENINTFEFHNNLYALLDATNMNSSIVCIHPFMGDVFKEELIDFWKEVKQAFIHARTNINTIIRFGESEIKNSINNLKYINESATIWELKEVIPKDSTAIIVSAGPSVASQIDDLKKAKGKAVIFAVDRVLDYLLDSGVVPDFVVTVDPMKETKYFSKRDDVSVPLIYFGDSNSDILDMHKGKKIISNCGEYLVSAYTKMDKLPPVTLLSPSVATVTFTNCIDLGFKHIVLVGQDLAFSETFTHVGGVEEKNEYQVEVYVNGVNGKLIKSRSDWKAFIIWFQDMITLHSEIQVIDAKLTGAKIAGAINMSLGEVVNSLTNEVWNENILFDLNNGFGEEEFIIFKEYLADCFDKMDKILEKASDGIEICKEYIALQKSNEMVENNRLMQIELKSVNDYIVEQPIYLLIDYLVKVKVANHLATIKNISGDLQDDELVTCEKSLEIYGAIIDSIEYIQPLLENSLNGLKTRNEVDVRSIV
ncbi:MAG: motility associated factor glycosyltransferase family protein [Anaerocolumna sp.]